MGRLKVELTYFKKSGKYYSEGSFFMHESISLWKIWEAVEAMQKVGVRPGLIRGTSEFITLINVPGHQHEHPHLVP